MSEQNAAKPPLGLASEITSGASFSMPQGPEPNRRNWMITCGAAGGVVGAADGGFVGNWDIHSNGNIERWIGHPDGRVEVVGQKWDVIWVILDDGTLEIKTEAVSNGNHMSADELLADIEKLIGGTVTKQKIPEKKQHNHHHAFTK
jgi:hypothetical protein